MGRGNKPSCTCKKKEGLRMRSDGLPFSFSHPRSLLRQRCFPLLSLRKKRHVLSSTHIPQKIQKRAGNEQRVYGGQLPRSVRCLRQGCGRGDFDSLCARACKELKAEHPGIEAVYVTSYLGISEQARIREMQMCGLCDGALYPPLEGTPPKFAISKRNEWMMENADLIIAYVERGYGGAYQSSPADSRAQKEENHQSV